MFLSKKRKKQDGGQERREIYYTKKAKKLEVRECVVCFFLVFESI